MTAVARQAGPGVGEPELCAPDALEIQDANLDG
jgi:hypothetical protein